MKLCNENTRKQETKDNESLSARDNQPSKTKTKLYQ